MLTASLIAHLSDTGPGITLSVIFCNSSSMDWRANIGHITNTIHCMRGLVELCVLILWFNVWYDTTVEKQSLYSGLVSPATPMANYIKNSKNS